MAKKKSEPRQFSLLELIPECIEELRQECEKKELAAVQQSLRTVKFEQMDELEVTRHNHNAVLRELNYTSDDKDYVSKFKPLTVEEHRANKAKEQTFIRQNIGISR